jgi:predicted negative regulator of RcsB-dependent stress response
VLNAAVILGIGGMLTYRAWRVDRVQPAEPAPAAAQVAATAEPAAARPTPSD